MQFVCNTSKLYLQLYAIMADQTCQGLVRLWLAKSPFLRHLNGMGRAPYNPPKAPSVPGVLKCIISQCQILLYYYCRYSFDVRLWQDFTKTSARLLGNL